MRSEAQLLLLGTTMNDEINMVDRNNATAWVVRLDYRLDDCLKNNYVAVGWSLAREAKQTQNWTEFKALVQKHYSYASNQALGNAAGSFWRFLFEIKEEDIVIVPVSGAFHLAKVMSDSYFSEGSKMVDCNWQRRVEWMTGSQIGIRRSFVSNAFQRRLRARQTCVQAGDFVGEAKESLNRTEPLSLVSKLKARAGSRVADVVDEVIGNRALEKLVMVLVQASGFHAEILPRRQSYTGDIDVLATKPLPAPAGALGGDSVISVGYQVKRHEGETDAQGLEQIADAVESGAADYGVLVTSAKRFSPDVIEKVGGPADRNELDSIEERYKKIWLINREQLSEWILDVGLEYIDRNFIIHN